MDYRRFYKNFWQELRVKQMKSIQLVKILLTHRNFNFVLRRMQQQPIENEFCDVQNVGCHCYKNFWEELHMTSFEDLKGRANRICDALGTESFIEVHDREFDIAELHPSDLCAITRLADVYNQIKTGTLSRDDGALKQKEIFEEWKKDIH